MTNLPLRVKKWEKLEDKTNETAPFLSPWK